MDSYYSEFFSDFEPDRPYASLIFSRDQHGRFACSGRVYDCGEWLPVRSMLTCGTNALRRDDSALSPDNVASRQSSTARLDSTLGSLGASRLAEARVAVVGCSGTGSPLIHALARSGVGEIVAVDYDQFDDPNLERMHGSYAKHLGSRPHKVALMEELVAAINPQCALTPIVGNILDDGVIDEFLRCDLVLGCTDTNHSRAMLGDLASHYLLPSIDVGVQVDGEKGEIDAQLGEICLNAPALPCPFCDGRIDIDRMAEELMTDQEREARREAASAAEAKGIDGRSYWIGDRPQLLTVGYLTMTFAGMVSCYATGWLTGIFRIPHSRLQLDLMAPLLGVQNVHRQRRHVCTCGSLLGRSDQALADRSVCRPSHWPNPVFLGKQQDD
jgi:hypothetical protein